MLEIAIIDVIICGPERLTIGSVLRGREKKAETMWIVWTESVCGIIR